jgi:O-antigen/teichoic acid export membrane protein
MYNVLIGKKYSSGDLGYFTQAKLFSDLASDTLTNVVQQVTFPILSSLQVDRDRLRQVYGRMLRLTAFIVFPTMILLALLADPLVRFFLTEKWLPTVVLLQWFALSRIFYPISSVNLNILNAVGRSDLFLKIDVSKLPIVLFVLLITLPLGIKAMVIGQFISSFIAFFINAYVPGKLLGYGLRRQLMDMIPSAIASILMSVVVMLLLSLFDNLLLKIFLGFTLGYTFYFFFSHVLKINELRDFIEFAQDGLKKLKN